MNDDEEENEGEEESEEEDEDVEVFEQVKKRGFKLNKKVSSKDPEKKEGDEKDKKVKKKEKKDIVCSHFKKARCFFGMSGKVPYNGISFCPYKHPTVCQRLLRHGDRGRAGCRGREAGCRDFHPRMCYSSINTRMCSNIKDCKNGYHMKGTIETSKKVPEKETVTKEKEKKQNNFPELQSTNKPNVSKEASTFGEILLQ